MHGKSAVRPVGEDPSPTLRRRAGTPGQRVQADDGQLRHQPGQQEAAPAPRPAAVRHRPSLPVEGLCPSWLFALLIGFRRRVEDFALVPRIFHHLEAFCIFCPSFSNSTSMFPSVDYFAPQSSNLPLNIGFCCMHGFLFKVSYWLTNASKSKHPSKMQVIVQKNVGGMISATINSIVHRQLDMFLGDYVVISDGVCVLSRS